MISQATRALGAPTFIGLALALVISGAALAQQDARRPPSPIREISGASERLEMTVNTSRILSLSRRLTEANRIPQAQVNNRDLLELTPLSPTQIQVFAKKPGVTQVNMWDENEQIYTVDVVIYADARELEMILQAEFPNASLRVKPVSNAVLISGYVDQPEHVSTIVTIAEDFYPKVVPNIRVGGVHQVLLHVKVMEVSRTKLRSLGIDWLAFGGDAKLTVTGAGVLQGAETLTLEVLNGGDRFFAVLEALRKDQLAKVLSEPTLITVSGRPAYFNVGGEIGYVESVDNKGVAQIGWKEFGTRVDFVPITLGNGRVRLEVRPCVSEVDRTNSYDDKPAIKKREVDTGVELMAGQTLAIAGLVQERVEAERKGLPWISEVPYVGPFFGRTEERINEVELLILVTPQIVDGVSPEDMPACLPGTRTASPTDCELYVKRYIEVPRCCPPGSPGTMDDGTVPMMAPEFIEPVGPETLGEPAPPATSGRLPGLLGPVGYDAKR